jgi:5'(3')-deoxyribonucleotidase
VIAYDFFSHLTERQQRRAHAILQSEHFWESMTPAYSTQHAVRQLLADGHEIRYITTPYIACENWCRIRTAWLVKHFRASREHIIFTHEKHLVLGDVFVDDSMSNVVAWGEWHAEAPATGRAFLIDKTYNQTNVPFVSNIKRIPDLSQLRAFLEVK